MGSPRFGVESAHTLFAAAGFLLALSVLISCANAAPADEGISAPAPGDTYRVYVGTYTGGNGPDKSRGIYLLELDSQTGALGAPELAGEAQNPSFLAIHPDRKFLYAVSEIGDFQGRRSGAVSAFAIDRATGRLTPINQQSSAGTGPCHLVVDRLGKNVLVANYGSGSVAVLPIDALGQLGPHSSAIQHEGKGTNPDRQEGPHAHSINLDAEGRFAVAADLGLDRVFIYAFDGSHGKLTPHRPAFTKVADGAGPRHFAFHPAGRFGYVISEMANTVTAFSYDPDQGTLTEIQSISTLPADFKGTSFTAEVQVHPSGKFLYGSNRGHDSIAVFAIDSESGKLSARGHELTQGKNPRNFAIDPTGAWLLAENQDSDTIVVFRIDKERGTLTPAGQTAHVSKPVCIKIIPKPGGAPR